MFDATVIPSYLGVEQRGSTSGAEDNLTNYILRQGEVKRLVLPNDKSSFSGHDIEYEVDVDHRDGTGVTTTVKYKGVTAINLFGGTGDRSEMTYRPATKEKEDGPSDGAKVLLLCISGDQQKAVILGGLATQKATDTTHHYTFEFNGFKINVDEDGQATLTFSGKTDISGKTTGPEEASGSSVKFEKDGSIVISGPKGDQVFKVDQTAKEISLKADTKWVVSVAGQTEITTKGNVFVESTEGAVHVRAADGLQVGDATNAFLLADVYRQAEGQMHQRLAQNLTAAGTAMTSASTSLFTAAPLLAVPVVGGIMALPALLKAATELATVGIQLNIASTALIGFETGYTDYLSKNNRND